MQQRIGNLLGISALDPREDVVSGRADRRGHVADDRDGCQQRPQQVHDVVRADEVHHCESVGDRLPERILETGPQLRVDEQRVEDRLHNRAEDGVLHGRQSLRDVALGQLRERFLELLGRLGQRSAQAAAEGLHERADCGRTGELVLDDLRQDRCRIGRDLLSQCHHILERRTEDRAELFDRVRQRRQLDRCRRVDRRHLHIRHRRSDRADGHSSNTRNRDARREIRANS